MKPSPMLKPPRERIYVKVTSDIDKTGYMQPRAIVLDDGRRFVIDQVSDFRPAAALDGSHSGVCYTIMIGGRQRHLFFERTSPLFHARIGRWYLENNRG